MSYSGAMGTMYATAGMGVVTPTDVRGRGTRGVKVTYSPRQVVTPTDVRGTRGFAIWRPPTREVKVTYRPPAPKGYAPPWRPRGFRSFQGIGSYTESPGFDYEYATAGLGAFDTPTSLGVRIVQRGLIAAGVSPSPGTADGVWGDKTQASLSAWLTTEAGRHRLSASRIRETFASIPRRASTITLPNALASRLEQLSGGYRAPTSRPIPGAPGEGADPGTLPGGEMVPGDGVNWGEVWPWAAGAGAFLALGGYFLWAGRRARRRPRTATVTANRRRRRRRSSRRRR